MMTRKLALKIMTGVLVALLIGAVGSENLFSMLGLDAERWRATALIVLSLAVYVCVRGYSAGEEQ